MRKRVLAMVCFVVLAFGANSVEASGVTSTSNSTGCTTQETTYFGSLLSSIEGVIVHIFGGSQTPAPNQPVCGVIVH